MRWSDPQQAITMANGIQYGPTASVWTRDYTNSGVGREEGVEEMLGYTETRAVNFLG